APSLPRAPEPGRAPRPAWGPALARPAAARGRRYGGCPGEPGHPAARGAGSRSAVAAPLPARHDRRGSGGDALAKKESVVAFADQRFSAQRAKAIAQFLREERRLFERCKMATTIELVPVNQLGEEPLAPTARRGHTLPREDAASHR